MVILPVYWLRYLALPRLTGSCPAQNLDSVESLQYPLEILVPGETDHTAHTHAELSPLHLDHYDQLDFSRAKWKGSC